MATIPKAVQQQADEADRKLKAMLGTDGIEPQSVEEESPKAEEPQVEPQAPKVDEPEEPIVDNDELDAKIDGLDPKQSDDDEPKASEGLSNEEIHKLKSEAGRVKALREEVEELKSQNETLRFELEQQKIATETARVESEYQPVEIDPELFSEDDREYLGEDYINMAQKIVNNAIAKKLADIDARLESKLQPLQENAQSQSQAVFFDRLVMRLGLNRERFIKIDESKQFEEYLSSEDVSGNILNDSLMRHINNGDVERTAKIYEGFIKTLKQPDSGMKRAPQPNLGATSQSDIQGTPTLPVGLQTHKEVANAFVQGRISADEKDALLAQLDAQVFTN